MEVKVGRNEPCPCGSGKKYKFCCAAKSEPAALSFTKDVRARAFDALGRFADREEFVALRLAQLGFFFGSKPPIWRRVVVNGDERLDRVQQNVQLPGSGCASRGYRRA